MSSGLVFDRDFVGGARMETVKAAAAAWLPGVHPEATAADRVIDDGSGDVETGERARVADVKAFVLGGKAVFTVLSLKTGTRYTYRVTRSDDGAVYFVGVLTGPSNETDYSYVGIIKGGRFMTTRKSRLGSDAPSVVAWRWVWEHIDRLPGCVEVWHEGACCRCGRRLTTPESIAAGIGPVCEGKGAW